jgi:CMP-N,N'-diacetyllegionaminic acid synthase
VIGTGRVLAVIPARGGSKGLPRKNLRCVGDKTLIEHAIAAARASRCVDEVVVSSDDQEILAAAERAGAVAVKRPASLAADDTPGVAPLLHVAEQMPGFDVVVLLQPTSPLRVAEDIDGCLELMAGQDAPACISVVQVKHHPMWNFTLGADASLTPILAVADRPDRRQAVPAVYAPNGAVYAARRTWLLEGGALVTGETLGWAMPAERSVDVDTEFDLQVADCLYRLRAGQH